MKGGERWKERKIVNKKTSTKENREGIKSPWRGILHLINGWLFAIIELFMKGVLGWFAVSPWWLMELSWARGLLYACQAWLQKRYYSICHIPFTPLPYSPSWQLTLAPTLSVSLSLSRALSHSSIFLYRSIHLCLWRSLPFLVYLLLLSVMSLSISLSLCIYSSFSL